MSVCIILRKYPHGGAERQALNFATYLKNNDVNVSLLALENLHNKKIYDIEIYAGKIQHFSKLNLLKKYYFLYKKIREIGSFKICISYLNLLLIPYILPNSCISALSMRMFYPNSINYFRAFLINKFDLKISNNLPQHVLNISTGNLNSLLQNNYVNNDYHINYEEIQIKNKLKNKDFILISNIKKRKSIEVAINAFKLLQKDGFRLKIAGKIEDLEYYNYLNSLTTSSSNIFFLGYLEQDELKKEFINSHGLIHTSTREGTANVILDAMSFGIPFWTTSIPENIALIEMNPLFLFDINDDNLLYNSIKDYFNLDFKVQKKFISYYRSKIDLFYSDNSSNNLKLLKTIKKIIVHD